MEQTAEKQNSADKEPKSFLSRLFGESKETINAVDFLKTQHREVEKLFAEIEGAGEKAFQTKGSLAEEVCNKLTLHALLEEKFLYPTVKTLDAKQFFEAAEEHDAVKMVIAKLRAVPSHGDNFAAKVKVLKELVEHHVKEEENEMFPLLKKELDHAKLEEIGKKMADYASTSEKQATAKTPPASKSAAAKANGNGHSKTTSKAKTAAKPATKLKAKVVTKAKAFAKSAKASKAVIASKAKKTTGRSRPSA
jgi:hypothetical protein